MAQYLNDDLEYVVEDGFDMAEPDGDEFVQGDRQRDGEGSDVGEKTDTSASEYREGKDIQGIPWGRLNYSRDKYREMRLKQYKNYVNLSGSPKVLEKDCEQVEKGSTFYDFQLNTRLVKSTIVHFQLLKNEIQIVPLHS